MRLLASLLAFAGLGDIGGQVLTVLLFMVGALVLLVLEFFIVSFGLLSVGSVAMAAGGIAWAFLRIGPVAGWITLGLTPVVGVLVVRWGLGRLQRTQLVVQGVSGSDAGIERAATRRGIAVGATGVMVTPGHPSGRARFERGEADVAVRGGFLDTGDRVEVIAIEGPSIFVRKLPTAGPDGAAGAVADTPADG